MNRREFMQSALFASLLAQAGCSTVKRACAGGAGMLPPSEGTMLGYFDPALKGKTIRVGVIGVGARGPSHTLKLGKQIEGAEVVAICDVFKERCTWLADDIEKAGRKRPDIYFGNEEVWKQLVDRDDIDIVYICTHWFFHTPMALYAMEHGKHVAIEVPCATTVDECWQLVDVSERTRRHCIILENCCYGENEQIMLEMCRKGLFGDLVHGAGAYLHDLCDYKFKKPNPANPGNRNAYYKQWRLEYTKTHDGNPYPTHGLGPIAKCMGINRGDQFEYLTSISSDVFRMPQYGAKLFGENSPEAKRSFYKQGDMSTTIIKTALGRTIRVDHDTTSPEPYSRVNMIKGTKGIMEDYPFRVAFLPNPHGWLSGDAVKKLREENRGQLWRESGDAARKSGGHGGMDFILNWKIIDTLRRGQPMELDVYDAAAWCCLVELTEESTLKRGAPVDIPDFTRGMWKTFRA